MKRRTIVAWGLTAVASAALFVFAGTRSRAVEASPTRTVASAPEAPELDAAAGTLGAWRESVSTSPIAQSRGAAADALDDEALRAALRRIAFVDGNDREALEERLFAVVANVANLDRTVFLLQGGGLAADAERFAAEEVGAVRAVLCAAALFCAPEGFASDLHAVGLARDGRAFIEDVLRALANVLPPVQATLAEMLGALRGADGRRVLDLSHEAVLRQVAAEHPEHEDLYLGMLASAGDDLAATEAEALDLFELEQADGPRLLTVSLTRLLAGPRADDVLRAARDLHDATETSAELREAITSAVAAAAPVDEAAAFLAERARETLFTEMFTLGDRPGGVEALAEAYFARRVAGVEEEARRVLVAGLERAGPRTLLAIAAEDPSARVRGQATLTLTSSAGVEANRALATFLRQGYERRADARLGLPAGSVVYATASLVRSGIGGDGRAETVAFLRELCLDATLDVYLRRHALEALAAELDPAEHAALAHELDR